MCSARVRVRPGKWTDVLVVGSIGRKGKKIGNWQFKRVGKGGSAILITNSLHVERLGTPKLVGRNMLGR